MINLFINDKLHTIEDRKLINDADKMIEYIIQLSRDDSSYNKNGVSVIIIHIDLKNANFQHNFYELREKIDNHAFEEISDVLLDYKIYRNVSILIILYNKRLDVNTTKAFSLDKFRSVVKYTFDFLYKEIGLNNLKKIIEDFSDVDNISNFLEYYVNENNIIDNNLDIDIGVCYEDDEDLNYDDEYDESEEDGINVEREIFLINIFSYDEILKIFDDIRTLFSIVDFFYPKQYKQKMQEYIIKAPLKRAIKNVFVKKINKIIKNDLDLLSAKVVFSNIDKNIQFCFELSDYYEIIKYVYKKKLNERILYYALYDLVHQTAFMDGWYIGDLLANSSYERYRFCIDNWLDFSMSIRGEVLFDEYINIYRYKRNLPKSITKLVLDEDLLYNIIKDTSHMTKKLNNVYMENFLRVLDNSLFNIKANRRITYKLKLEEKNNCIEITKL